MSACGQLISWRVRRVEISLLLFFFNNIVAFKNLLETMKYGHTNLLHVFTNESNNDFILPIYPLSYYIHTWIFKITADTRQWNMLIAKGRSSRLNLVEVRNLYALYAASQQKRERMQRGYILWDIVQTYILLHFIFDEILWKVSSVYIVEIWNQTLAGASKIFAKSTVMRKCSEGWQHINLRMFCKKTLRAEIIYCKQRFYDCICGWGVCWNIIEML